MTKYFGGSTATAIAALMLATACDQADGVGQSDGGTAGSSGSGVEDDNGGAGNDSDPDDGDPDDGDPDDGDPGDGDPGDGDPDDGDPDDGDPDDGDPDDGDPDDGDPGGTDDGGTDDGADACAGLMAPDCITTAGCTYDPVAMTCAETPDVACNGLAPQECVLTPGCTVDPATTACIEGMGPGGPDVCEQVPLEFCDMAPGCAVVGGACTTSP